jgi:hypothetical protein
MTTEEWNQKRKLWADIVEGVIPANRLVDVFRVAIRNHSDSFPLAVSELIPAWNVLKGDEWQRQQSAPRDCPTCITAKAQNLPCPYHQRDYRIV